MILSKAFSLPISMTASTAVRECRKVRAPTTFGAVNAWTLPRTTTNAYKKKLLIILRKIYNSRRIPAVLDPITGRNFSSFLFFSLFPRWQTLSAWAYLDTYLDYVVRVKQRVRRTNTVPVAAKSDESGSSTSMTRETLTWGGRWRHHSFFVRSKNQNTKYIR